jgi:hypothetical protein
MIADMERERRGPTAEQELKSLLDVNVAVSRHLERDELFGAIASCLRNIVETDRFGIELPIDGKRLQVTSSPQPASLHQRSPRCFPPKARSVTQ